MRPGAKRIAGWLAIVAIALHTALWGLAPLAATAADPFSVICHSGVAANPAADDSTGAPASAPTQACDHCNLCSAAPTPATLNDTPVGRLVPARVLDLLRPLSTAATANLATTPKLAQGPPAFA